MFLANVQLTTRKKCERGYVLSLSLCGVCLNSGRRRPKTFSLGESCCSFRINANSKTQTEIQNNLNNRNELQIKRNAAESQNKYINKRCRGKNTNTENKCNRKTLHNQSTQRKFSRASAFDPTEKERPDKRVCLFLKREEK